MKVVEAFSGIGAQSKALSNISVDYELVATIEWEMGAIYAYDIIHNGQQDLSPYLDMDKEELIEVLSKYSLSSNGKEPIGKNTLKMFTADALRRVYAAIKRTNNLVSIVDVKAEDLKKQIDLFTYSFPCQDLSLSGSWHGHIKGIDRDANNRSSMLWQVERILIEMIENDQPLPHYLLMENVTNIMSARHIDNFNEWQNFLSDNGYFNKVYKLNAIDFGIPQRRNRAFMLSVYIGDNHENRNTEMREMLEEYFMTHNLEDFVFEQEINIEDFLRIDYENSIFKDEAQMVMPNDTPSRHKIRKENDLIYNGVRQQNYVRTITTKQDRHPNSGVISLEGEPNMLRDGKMNYRFLTPRECFLLMGFDENDYQSVVDNNFMVNSKRKFLGIDKLNKLAGNSIVVDILERVFEQVIHLDQELFNNRINARVD